MLHSKFVHSTGYRFTLLFSGRSRDNATDGVRDYGEHQIHAEFNDQCSCADRDRQTPDQSKYLDCPLPGEASNHVLHPQMAEQSAEEPECCDYENIDEHGGKSLRAFSPTIPPVKLARDGVGCKKSAATRAALSRAVR